MPQFILQECNEKRYNRKHIDGYIREAISATPSMQEKIIHGVQLIKDYVHTGNELGFYNSKNGRVMQLNGMDIDALVLDIFVGIAYCQTPELFTSVTAAMASRLRFNDKLDAIKTVAELVAILCQTDAFDIDKPTKFSSLMVKSCIPLSDKLLDYIFHSAYLPPMVCEPLKLTSNFSSGYLTHNDSLVLGNGNHHDGDLCLDVLNTMNQVELKLDLDYLCKVEEDPTFDIRTQDQYDLWMDFKKQSYRFYNLMQSQGNKFYLTHKVDKRGRIYAQGYHISSAGNPFKKAMIELAHEELIEGVPTC